MSLSHQQKNTIFENLIQFSNFLFFILSVEHLMISITLWSKYDPQEIHIVKILFHHLESKIVILGI